MKYRPIFLLVSLTLISISLFSIFRFGFKKSIDFAGGSVWEINTTIQDQLVVEKFFNDKNISISSISNNGQGRYLIKFSNIDTNQKTELNDELSKVDKDFSELKFETLGPSLGKELLKKTIYAIILASVALFIFIGSRFKDLTFGGSAILAMLHDTIILIGSFSLFGHFFGAELDALFVTALLTTISASVHDTIVTFDRIRELKKHSTTVNWLPLTNQAVSETIVRSINNSMTVIIMLLSLVLLGGDSTKWFATALLVGVICGTYSSLGVAIPLVLFWKRKEINKNN